MISVKYQNQARGRNNDMKAVVQHLEYEKWHHSKCP
jgi:hypothetical protein